MFHCSYSHSCFILEKKQKPLPSFVKRKNSSPRFQDVSSRLLLHAKTHEISSMVTQLASLAQMWNWGNSWMVITMITWWLILHECYCGCLHEIEYFMVTANRERDCRLAGVQIWEVWLLKHLKPFKDSVETSWLSSCQGCFFSSPFWKSCHLLR